MAAERAAGRLPEDVRRAGKPYDISSPPRKIEIKAFSRSARGQALALEQSQVAQARRDPANYYLYVVDHVADPSQTAVRIVHGDPPHRHSRPDTTHDHLLGHTPHR